MATKNTLNKNAVNAVAETAQPKEPVYVRSSNAKDDPNVFIGVNGVNYVFPKDEEVMLPPEAAAEYNRAEKAKKMQDKTIKKLPKKFA